MAALDFSRHKKTGIENNAGLSPLSQSWMHGKQEYYHNTNGDCLSDMD